MKGCEKNWSRFLCMYCINFIKIFDMKNSCEGEYVLYKCKDIIASNIFKHYVGAIIISGNRK